ncbi:MAG: type I restriction enzyme HsdR N-terminal domain-containing protein [Desulfobacterales bacterium]
MGTHHLILGETTDFITGKTVTDTHDERARQKIAKFLVEEKGYKKTEIYTNLRLPLEINGETGNVQVDFFVKPDGLPFMIMLFRPGSLVSRQRTALAAARLIADKPVPYTAVTNAEDAQIMETFSGKVIGTGLNAVFSRQEAIEKREASLLPGLTDEHKTMEKRILFAMEVLTQKECDDYKCDNL